MGKCVGCCTCKPCVFEMVFIWALRVYYNAILKLYYCK